MQRRQDRRRGASAEKILSSGFADGYHRGMLEPSFDGNGVKAFSDGADPPHDFDVVLATDFFFDNRRRRKEPHAVLAENFHQRRIFEFAQDARPQFMLVKPLVKFAADRRAFCRDEKRSLIERSRELGPVRCGQFRSRKEREIAFAQ